MSFLRMLLSVVCDGFIILILSKNDSLIRLNCSVPVVLYSPAIQIHRASIFHAAVQSWLPELYRGSPFTLPPLFCYF